MTKTCLSCNQKLTPKNTSRLCSNCYNTAYKNQYTKNYKKIKTDYIKSLPVDMLLELMGYKV